MYFSVDWSSSWLVALTIATSRSGAMLLATLAMLMLVWSFTTPIALRMLNAMVCFESTLSSLDLRGDRKRERDGNEVLLRRWMCGGDGIGI